jgi:TrmH family RNA methyltransferase
VANSERRAGGVSPDETVDALTERSARVVAAHKLLRRSRRREAGEFLADGAQAVREAVALERQQPGVVRELFVTAAAAARHVEIVREALRIEVPVTQVTDRAAAKLSDAVTPQGLTARCALPASADTGDCALAAMLAAGPTLIAVLVETSDPGNAGTIIRLADAFGADAVIAAGDGVDPWGPKAVRASVGSIFHLPVLRAADPTALLSTLAGAGLTTLATTGSADIDLDGDAGRALLAAPTAWLFGNEAHGLPGGAIGGADHTVRIPIYGRAESLNLATAAAICLHASASVHRRDEAAAQGVPSVSEARP